MDVHPQSSIGLQTSRSCHLSLLCLQKNLKRIEELQITSTGVSSFFVKQNIHVYEDMKASEKRKGRNAHGRSVCKLMVVGVLLLCLLGGMCYSSKLRSDSQIQLSRLSALTEQAQTAAGALSALREAAAVRSTSGSGSSTSSWGRSGRNSSRSSGLEAPLPVPAVTAPAQQSTFSIVSTHCLASL